MNAAAILPPSGLTRIIDGLFETVALGLARLRRGGLHFNAPATTQATLIDRLAKVLRFALLMLACRLDPAPACSSASKPTQVGGSFRPHRPRFRLFAPSLRLRDSDAPKGPVPPAFSVRDRDPCLTVQRKLDALTRVAADPLPYARRIARRLPTRLMVIGWRPPRRPPPTDRRAYWEELVEAWREAWFQLHDFRRRTGNSAIGQATAS